MATWLSLVMKDAFALVGMSAYLAIVVDVPGKPTAVALIAAFTLLNVIGSKASAVVQMALVGFVSGVLAWFLLWGLPEVRVAPGSSSRFSTTERRASSARLAWCS